MTDMPIVKCDGCGEHGRRRPDRLCPDFWYFIESVDAHNSRHIYVVFACSVKCRDGLWQLGPGTTVVEDNRRRIAARTRKALS